MNKSYYAIIPANVRYDKNLPANAKLLYGEITALTNEKGFCWATNGYFADLYGASNRTIQRWVKALEDSGYIYINTTMSNHGSIRKITLNVGGDKNVTGGVTKMSHPHDKNVTHNNTVNNTIEEREEKPPQLIPLKSSSLRGGDGAGAILADMYKAWGLKRKSKWVEIEALKVKPGDWEEIKTHYPNYLHRTSTTGSDNKQFRSTLLNYFRKELWVNNPNPVTAPVNQIPTIKKVNQIPR